VTANSITSTIQGLKTDTITKIRYFNDRSNPLIPVEENIMTISNFVDYNILKDIPSGFLTRNDETNSSITVNAFYSDPDNAITGMVSAAIFDASDLTTPLEIISVANSSVLTVVTFNNGLLADRDYVIKLNATNIDRNSGLNAIQELAAINIKTSIALAINFENITTGLISQNSVQVSSSQISGNGVIAIESGTITVQKTPENALTVTGSVLNESVTEQLSQAVINQFKIGNMTSLISIGQLNADTYYRIIFNFKDINNNDIEVYYNSSYEANNKFFT